MRRVVVKVGSGVLSEDDGIAVVRMQNLVEFLVRLRTSYEVVLVSSGAVAAGFSALPLDRSEVKNKQALASIGQPILMARYAKKFDKHDVLVAQVLLSAANFCNAEETGRIRDTIDTLLQNGVMPIINENDATTTKELVLGDNDQLSAYVTNHIDADLLIILSDIDAYYNKDPRSFDDALSLAEVSSINQSELEQSVTPNHKFATGGIVTKLKAAAYLLQNSKKMFLASGYNLGDVESFMFDGVQIGGTLFKKGES